MKDPRRTYEDYEDLGQRLSVLEDALIAFQAKVLDMWKWGDEQGRPMPSTYDTPVLDMVITLQRLHQDLTLECHTEIDAADVPEGKAPVPMPFDQRDPFGA
jgi:hypothetical protein